MKTKNDIIEEWKEKLAYHFCMNKSAGGRWYLYDHATDSIATVEDLQGFLEQAMDAMCDATAEAGKVEHFVPPIKFTEDFTTKAWNACAKQSESQLNSFMEE
ncbi:MAG: hypothetical protein KGL39_32850 [Patescibacteria group bacterium]|nr:hypothetical protein [Patescibacteria group bacterium]